MQAPPRSLSRDEVVFSLLTTDRSSNPQRGAQRGRASPGASAHLKKELARAEQRPAAKTLRLQGARLHRFTNVAGADSTLLPRSAVDERAHGRAYMGQKQLEMIMAMRPHSLPPAPPRTGGSQVAVRWWVVCDDDSFVFVDLYISLLASLNDSEPLLVGGGQGQISFCSHVVPGGLRTACSDRLESEGGTALLLRHALPAASAAAKAGAVQVGLLPRRGDQERAFERAFQERHGTRPVFQFHSGGITFALTDAAVRLMQRSIRAGRCPDAPFTDAAAGACALASGVRQLLLPGTWLQNNPKRPFGAWPIGERLISYHRLPPHVAMCWARHAQSGGADAHTECEPCDDPVRDGLS